MSKQDACDSHQTADHKKTSFLQLTVIADNREEAVDLIQHLTEKHIVACAQVQGPESALIDEDPGNWRCRFKTSNELYPQVRAEITSFFFEKEYSLQCLPIVKGSDSFLNWLKKELST